MNDKWLDQAIRIQSLAQSGLAYCRDTYDKERYEELRSISAEMLADRTGLPVGHVRDVFCCETGYQTPKVDTRAAIIENGKILLVHEKNGTWALPGGWCDVDQSVASNALKEVKEEAGLDASVEKLIAVQDWRRRNVCNYLFGVVKIFVLCRSICGSFSENTETTGTGYFAPDELPESLAVEKNTKEQILMCFAAASDPNWIPPLD